MPLPAPLPTSRLLIRPFDPAADLPGLPALPSDPLSDDEKWLRWAVEYHDRVQKYYKPPRGDNALLLKSTGELVGLCGIIGCLIPYELMPEPEEHEPFDPSCEVDGIFYEIRPPYRRQGYATEASLALIDYAFQVMGIRRITATTSLDNDASMSIIKKLGMRFKVNDPDVEGYFPPYMEVVGVLLNPAWRPAAA